LISDNNYGIFSSTTVKDCAISSNVIQNHKSKAISLLCENIIIFNNHINGALIGVDFFKEWNRFSNHICNNNILNCKICGFFELYVFHDFWDGIPNCWEFN